MTALASPILALLQALNISWCNFGDAAAIVVAQAVEVHAQIIELDLSFNQLTAAVVQPLAQVRHLAGRALEEGKRVLTCLLPLSQAVQENHSLRTLDIRGNSFGATVHSALQKVQLAMLCVRLAL